MHHGLAAAPFRDTLAWRMARDAVRDREREPVRRRSVLAPGRPGRRGGPCVALACVFAGVRAGVRAAESSA